MTHKKKVVLLALIAALSLAVLPLSAQSQTSAATQGVFGTEVDDFLDVHNYGEVEFDKWFGYAGAGTGYFSLGYASKLSGATYLGLGYSGNLFASWFNKDKSSTVTYDPAGNPEKTKTEEGEYYYPPSPGGASPYWRHATDNSYIYNGITVLVGLSGMGLRLNVSENLQFWGAPDYDTYNPNTHFSSGTIPSTFNTVTETPGKDKVEYNNKLETYSKVLGSISPSITWGMALSGGKLKPSVSVGASFSPDAEKLEYSNYTTENGVVTGTKATKLHGADYSSLSPQLGLGLGYVLKEEGPVAVEVGLGYSINVPLYNNQYEAFGKSGSVGGTYYLSSTKDVTEGPTTTVRETSNISFTERGGLSNYLTPSITYTNEISDVFEAGFSAELPVRLSFSSSERWNETRDITTTTVAYDSTKNTVLAKNSVGPKTKTETTGFGLTPRIAAGAVYALSPGKIALTSGISVGLPFSYTVTREAQGSGFGSYSETNRDYQGNDITPPKYGPANTSLNRTEAVGEDISWGSVQTEVSLGFTVFFGPKATLDAVFVTESSSGYTSYDVDISKLNLIFTLKN
jgi:hypothetical protein